MLGTSPPSGARLQGWVSHVQDAVKQPDGMYDNTLAGDGLWEAHADALIAEARQHGFVPYWLTKKRPRGPAVDAWAKQFLDAHRY